MFIYQKNKLIIKNLNKIILLKNNQIILKTKDQNIVVSGESLSLGYYECNEVHIIGKIKDININEI